MIVTLLNIIFSTLSALSNIFSRIIFSLIAYLFVLIVQAFKVPGEAAKGALEQVAEAIKACLEYVLELLIEVISTIISTLLDSLKEGIVGSAVATVAVIGGIVEATRTSLNGLFENLPDLVESFSEMISTMMLDLWNNYKDAIGYVTENA